ncbi:hypothetical protein CCACVL1_30707 [Corchorus capsularis]|uniref:Uncharacterized protein n=1 Tax=Corchorus capsularis TaxID=210143 RepID=A0A1R3FVW7_COCAP|nr:hypothetical protein CCACVL1_30707 [Corchorus capsularis]
MVEEAEGGDPWPAPVSHKVKTF